MKATKYIMILTLLAITLSAEAQLRRTVYARGPVTTEERKAGSFHSVKVSTGITVYLTQGNEESIKVEADENLHEYIATEIRGGVLNIYSEFSIRNAKSRKVYVTIKEVKSLKTSSAGDIKGLTPLVADMLKLSTSSAGDINLEVSAKEIEAVTSSSGDITLQGTADKLTAHLSSAGDLHAFELTVKEAEISVSSAGDAKITVTERLKARASSAGDIHYRGKPKYVDAHSSSAGSIRGF
ncbi:MAG: head GIN domain-containing protein [Bacteroidales bacterium]